MKKTGYLLCMAFLLAVLASCGKKEETVELLQAVHERFRYAGTEDADAIAVDEEGLLYTLHSVFVEGETVSVQQLEVYDLAGNCIKQQELSFGNGAAMCIVVENDLLYCVATKSTRDITPTLYTIDTETWEVTEVYNFSEYSDISQMANIGDSCYVFGVLSNPPVKNYTLHPDVIDYSYNGEAVSRINIKTKKPETELLQVDFPMGIFETERDTLAVYHYSEENGFGFLEYSPKKGRLKELGWKNNLGTEREFMGCKDGYLFNKEYRLYYGTLDGREAEISSEDIFIWNSPAYVKGFAFYKNLYADKMVERICVEDILKGNQTIHLLMHEDTMDKPYGCGYHMEKEVLASEQYALKVLAQDKDFDVYVLSSNDSSSYNLKKNGAFYPLNEVEGVQEYLDACFPYVKELATNEDGDIWMLPVDLAIPGLIYNKEYCDKMGVAFSELDYAEFLAFTEQMQKEHPEQVSLSFYLACDNFLARYLQSNTSFDTGQFRNYAEKLKKIWDGGKGEWWMQADIHNAIRNGEHTEFYYMYSMYHMEVVSLLKPLENLPHIGMTGIPNVADEGNVGALTFLAVNPQAENLEATLQYISSFAEFKRNQKNSMILKDWSTYTDTPFMRDRYEIYANGTVRFDMDAEVYEDSFYDYIFGNMELEDMIQEIERRYQLYVGE